MDSAKPTALIAEDNAALRRVIGFTLGGCGFDVTAVPDGAAAFEAARDTAFDLIITDQQMPRMNGLELIERLRETPTNSATPIVLLTAKGLELQFEQLRQQYGLAAMVAKPFSPTELGAVAERLVALPH